MAIPPEVLYDDFIVRSVDVGNPGIHHQKRYEEFLKVPREWTPTSFSVFNKEDINAATKLASEYLQHAQQHPNEHEKAVHHVLNKAQEHRDNQTHDAEVIRYATKLFAVHHPGARKVLAFPRLIQRAPSLALSSTNNSDPLAWLIEDPNLNEHHEHWHLVYPAGSGIPSKDRHGEMFAYMHRQMLARYDAELINIGLPPVKAFDLDNPILPPYTPSSHLLHDKDKEDRRFTFQSRADDLKLSDDNINDLKTYTENIQKAITDQYFTTDNGQKVPITPHNLGAVIEPNEQTLVDYEYRGLHGMGHNMISGVTGVPNGGVIGDPRTACRDPAFWQWHRFIDNLFSTWQDAQPVYDWTGDNTPPPIEVQAINLAFNDTIQNSNDINEINKFATTELQTTYLNRTFIWKEDDNSENTVTYLFPREFTYYFSVQNTSNETISATFRIFLAPTSKIDSRVHWIELEKFRQDIPTSDKPTIVSRNCDLSSVIRKPAQKFFKDLDEPTLTAKRDGEDDWCDCGWPFHLLLPKGNEEGAEFKLFVFISDGNKDQVEEPSKCGSLSYCGAKDKYPDAKPMGYPFDRPFKNGRFSDTFGGLSNTKELDITIKLYPYENAQWAKPYAQP